MAINPLGLILLALGIACLYMGVFGTYPQVLKMLRVPGFAHPHHLQG